MVLFTSIFVSRSDAAGDAVSEVCSSISPQMVSLSQCFSSLSGRWSQTKFAYVTFLCFGTACLFINRIVPDPFTLSGIPLDNQPSSLAVEVDQISWSFPANNWSIVCFSPSAVNMWLAIPCSDWEGECSLGRGALSTTLGDPALWLGLKASGTLGSGAAWCGSMDDSCTVLHHFRGCY